jgi:hypothetical protein
MAYSGGMTENPPPSPPPSPPSSALSAHLDAAHANRLREAGPVWATFVGAGFQDGMAVLLDFVLYGRDEPAARALGAQIEKTYRVAIEPVAGEGWMVTGTTRPYASRLTEASHRDWVQFLCELGTRHGCVFSAWIVESPELEIRVSSAAFEAVGGDA